VYQLHNSLDEFKKKEHGIYAIVANGPGSAPLGNLGDQKQEGIQHQEQPQGIYAVVRKTSSVKPTRQAPPVPPHSKEMNILTDETPPESASDSNSAEGNKGREMLMSFGSGSDTDFLAQFRKHKRSLSDSLVITKAIEMGQATGSTDQNKLTPPISTIKKTNSATNLSSEKLMNDKGFELPANVKKKKRFNKRRKTIAHGGRRLSRSRSPPSEPPPPPPSGEKPEVNQTIIDALYALDEELGQNVGVLPNNSMSSDAAPVQIDHTTVFATFQSPLASAHSPMSPNTAQTLNSADSDYPHNENAQHEKSNGDVIHQEKQNGHVPGVDEVDFHTENVDESHCIRPSAAAGKAKLGQVKGDTPQEEITKLKKKLPPPVKPKPYKPAPPARTTSHNKTAELKSNKAVQSSVTGSPSSLKPPATPDTKQNKEVTEQQKRSPPRVTFPEDIEKTVNKKTLTTFSLDDLNKEIRERGGMKGNPLSPSKVKNSSGASAFPLSNDSPLSPSKVKGAGAFPLSNDGPLSPSKVKGTSAFPLSNDSPLSPSKVKGTSAFPLSNDSPLSPSKVKGASAFPLSNDSFTVTAGTSIPHSATEESMTKIFQNWPNPGLTNGSVTDPMSPVHSEPSQWRDSMADQHIYDDPWDRKMRANLLSRSQGSLKAGDRNSLERRRTNSNGASYVNGSGRMGLLNHNSFEQRNNVVMAPRRGASIEDLYNRNATVTAFTDNFTKKGASTENLSSLDPSSPLYVYRKALKNHQQQQQEQEEKERSYTLPSKGSAARRWSQQGLLPQQSAQTSLHPRVNNGPINSSGNAPPSARMVTSMQNDNRRFPMSGQQQPMQFQHMTDSQSLQARPAKRTNMGYYPKTNPNYRPHILNTGGRSIPTREQNGINLNRRAMNGNSQLMTRRVPDDWEYYQSGTRITYDKTSDTTILRSLV